MEPEIYASRMLLLATLWSSQQFRSNAIGIPIPQIVSMFMPGNDVKQPSLQTVTVTWAHLQCNIMGGK